ncbi:ras GTPase-activating protein 3-like isoform X2, partial [Biomphalaria pfeifferi]
EAKDLPATSFSSSSRNTCCAIKIDSEEIFRTSIVEKSLKTMPENGDRKLCSSTL